jgi:RHS repeat-associated protein
VAEINADGTATIFIGNYFEGAYPEPEPPPQPLKFYMPFVSNAEEATDLFEPITARMGTLYFYADGQRIAMKKDGVVSCIYGDQLGSVSAVADAGGNLISKTLYHPWGTTRYIQGISPTDYGYTGQMKEGDIYFYNARWYDPQLGRFMQADTFVPTAQGTQGFDRYAYVNNNPIRYIDPSGMRLVNTMMTDGSFECPGCKQNSIIDALYRHYGWTFGVGDWSLNDVESVLEAANSIKNYFDKIGHNGKQWIQHYLGGVTFKEVSPEEDWLFTMFPRVPAYVFPVKTVNKNRNLGWDYKTVVHEMGHVLENIQAGTCAAVIGGGWADALYRFAGGVPRGPRFFGGVDSRIVQKDFFLDEDDYGYHSSADFFAQNFQYEILGQFDMIGTNKAASVYMNVLLVSLADKLK